MKNTKNIKTFLIHLGLYSLVILSYFVIFSSVISSVLESLMMGTSQYIALPILLFLSALYIIPLWKWYQHDLKLEVKKTRIISSVWLPVILLIAFIIFQKLMPTNPSENQNNVEMLIAYQPAFAFIFVVFLAPIVEELLTRGFMAKFFFSNQVTSLRKLLYILASSSLFSLLHRPATPGQFLTYFIMGVIFALGYLCRKDLRYAIALHMANNLLAFLLLIFLR